VSIEQTAPAHPYRAFAIRAGLGLAVVAVLLWRYDARPIFRILSRERPMYFAVVVALYVAGQAMCAYRWQLLAAILKVHGRYREFLAYTFVGMFTNLFVPGLMAGDAARSVYLGRRHGRMGEAIASVVADRAVGLVGLFWLAAFTAIFLNFAPIPSSVIMPTIVVGAIAFAGFLAAPLVARLIHLMPRPVRRRNHRAVFASSSDADPGNRIVDLAAGNPGSGPVYIGGWTWPDSAALAVYSLRSDCECVRESAAYVERPGDS
jgi:uncharacterized membrane protein YbhN (UPF0104 family)